MADDGRLAVVPGHAALAHVAAREAPGRARARADCEPGGRDRVQGRSAPGRLGRSRLLVVLETLAPAERAAFVLHDMFDLPFDEIAPIVGRSPTAARQLASRARRRVQGATTVPDADRTRQREIVDAFLAASRSGDFDTLLALLDPDVVLRADPAAVQAGASSEVRGTAAVAKTFSGRARAAQLALVNGAAGAVWAPGGRPRVVFGFTIARGKIVEIDLVADPERLRKLDLVVVND